ncbi:tape measure protein, partial [Endozoicomonas sp. ONNA1]|uniref:tape measure protein n=1 Tax=Endozoicomonas sp. ONNA1 TaxID=2828740 RepID=UPI002149143B
MTEYANLSIRVNSQGVKQAERELKSLESQSERTERSATSLGDAVGAAGGAIAAYFTAQAAIAVVNTADAFNLLQARVKRLADSSEDAAAKYGELTRISIDAGTDLKTVVQLWENLDQTLSELGKSDDEIIQLTETLQKLGVVGGSSTEEMSNAMQQFGQAMAGGILRAEEFNSIIENTPEVARAMARGMGMSMGEMRQAMLDGQLTADKVFDSLISQVGATNEDFAKMPRTVKQAFNSLITSSGNALAEINNLTGATNGLVSIIDLLSESITRAANELDYLTAGFNEVANIDNLVSARKAVDEVRVELVELEEQLSSLKSGGEGLVIFSDTDQTIKEIEEKINQLRERETALVKRI